MRTAYDTINEEYYKQIKKLYDLLLNPEADTEEQQQILDFVYSKYGNTDIKTLLKKKAEKANDLLLTMREDIAREGENPLHRVSRTYPCIEIENFCINETARDKWKSYGMPRNIGETVFWNKILPLVEKIEKIVGCTHIFLFAADSTADERLIRYYRQRLGFSTTTSLGANKPIYDLLCQLMYQTIENAKEMRDDFFASFND